MNALIRKFRVGSTAGVVMSLAMAGVLAMAPMSNAMAKSKKGKIVKIEGSSTSGYRTASYYWSVKAYRTCGGFGYKTVNYKTYRKGPQYVVEAKVKC